MPPQPVLTKGQSLRSEAGHQYTVTRKLGEGQFAEVWEVRQSGAGSDLRVSACEPCLAPWAAADTLHKVPITSGGVHGCALSTDTCTPRRQLCPTPGLPCVSSMWMLLLCACSLPSRWRRSPTGSRWCMKPK